MHLMALGQFVFSLSTLAFDDFRRQCSWRHPENNRIGVLPARQFLGPQADTININGLLMPLVAGQPSAIRQLREMANDGKAYALVSGTGEVFGAYVIESLDESRSALLGNGAARRIEFSLTLQRKPDSTAEAGGGAAPASGDDWAWGM